MFGENFYHGSLRRYTVAFGQMFDDIVVRRFAEDDSTVIQTIVVPISYGPKERYMVKKEQNPNLAQEIATQLPRLGFEITGMTYAPDRAKGLTVRNTAISTSDPQLFRRQFAPAPWNINFALYSFVRFAEDGMQITEQILPFFRPSWTNTVKVVPRMGIELDTPCELVGVNVIDSYQWDMHSDKRSIILTYDFVMHGAFFGPVNTSGVIKRVQVDFNVVTPKTNTASMLGITYPSITDNEVERTGRSSRIVIQPGLLANGVGTTNSAASVAYSTISANSDWKYATNTHFYDDGYKYSPSLGIDEPVDEPDDDVMFLDDIT